MIAQQHIHIRLVHQHQVQAAVAVVVHYLMTIKRHRHLHSSSSVPPGLSEGICDEVKLQDASGYEACAIECVAATCCQPEDGQPSCMSTCGEQCMLYMDCMGLSRVEPPPNFSIDGALSTNEGGMSHATSIPPPTSASDTKLSQSDTLSASYYEGYNANLSHSQG